MQYPQQTPNIFIIGGSPLFEKIAMAYRLDCRLSAVLHKTAPLWMGLLLGLHFAVWQFLRPIQWEYGVAVIGLAVLAFVIFANHWFGRQKFGANTFRLRFDLALRVLYVAVVFGLALEYVEVDYMPAINYLEHLKVRRHVFAPVLASVVICVLGLLLTAPIWGESKLRIYALALALAGCWLGFASNANTSLVIQSRPDIKTEVRAASMRHKSEDSVLNALDIRALSTMDTPASLNQRVRSRITAERNWCLLVALVSFGLCMVSVWALRTWLEGHGVHSQQEFLAIVQYLQDWPRIAA